MIPMRKNPTRSITVNGEEIKLYYIRELANALGRTTQTVRKWEIAGVIPNSCFRDPTNKRLYTKEQIDIITKIAEECYIKQGSSIAGTSFSKKVHKSLEEHNKKYFK